MSKVYKPNKLDFEAGYQAGHTDGIKAGYLEAGYTLKDVDGKLITKPDGVEVWWASYEKSLRECPDFPSMKRRHDSLS